MSTGRLSVLVAVVSLCVPVIAHGQITFGERTYDYERSDVLPGTSEFVRQETYWEAYAPAENGGAPELLGYVFITDDLVDVPGYSGHTLNTLVGMGIDGDITGAKIIRHSEPIVLIGLKDEVIHDFVDQYIGKNIRDRIIISDSDKQGYVTIDAISGATVTAVAENTTILEAGRLVGRNAGFLSAADVRKRRVSELFEPATWDELVAAGSIGELTVMPRDVGLDGTSALLDLRFAVLDPPMIGHNLLGERFYAIVRERLADRGGSAIYVASNGSVSFKGAGFARGGIFDRFSLEQSGRLFVFKDTEYTNFPEVDCEGSPRFGEGGIFYIEGGEFDPTSPFTFHLTVPYRIQDRRSYATFVADHALPADLVEEEVPFWLARWQASAWRAAALGLFLITVAVLFVCRKRVLPWRKLIHRSVAAVAAIVVGFGLKAQPSTTQLLTPANSALDRRFPFEIFLSEPFIFIFWIVILASMPFWGRGFFCGWVCPYGALLEVLISFWEKLVPERIRHRIEQWEPPRVWRLGKYVTFVVILGVAFVNLPLAEMLDEVEPFKTLVLRLARPAPFVAYFVGLTLLSVVVYRFFCRFLCPLGGALALPSRRPLLPLVRYERCTTCKICYRGCEPRAITWETGRIDYRECLQCWDCQMTATDENVCPALIEVGRETPGEKPRLMPGGSALLLLALLLWPTTAAAVTRTVSPGERALGAAIAASADGDSILVAAGAYSENVVVDRRLTIIGADGAVIDAGGSGHVLVIEVPDVIVQGLTLRGSGDDTMQSDAGIRVQQAASDVQLIDNRTVGCWFGIWLHGCKRPRLTGNRVEGKADLSRNARGDGIHLWDVEGAEIVDNVVLDSRDGIYMELSKDCRVVGNTILRSRYSVHTMWCDRSVYNENTASENLVGLALMFSKKIEARNNTLNNNLTHGLLMIQVTRGNAIDNIIIGNSKGMFVYNSLYNTIRGNLIARNKLGIHYWGGSEDNEIVNNALIENEIQAKFVAGHDQTWDGNFWSDYVGWDLDGDGVGEAPYRSNTLVDALLWRYPLAKLLVASPAFQALALAEREFPVITVPKAVDHTPRMVPAMSDWAALLERYQTSGGDYYGSMEKLPHIPGGR